MKIPILGKFLKGTKPAPEPSTPLPQEPQVVSTPPETVQPVSEQTDAPDIKRGADFLIINHGSKQVLKRKIGAVYLASLDPKPIQQVVF